MAMSLAVASGLEAVAGFSPRVKWPNDLVWPGDGSSPDRKLAGILAEADWPAGAAPAAGPRPPGRRERVPVVVGVGVNVAWPTDLPDDLAEVAIACNHITGSPVDREDLLVGILEALATRYERVVRGEIDALRIEWLERSATLGRAVRVELGPDDVIGTAVDVNDRGHLVVEVPGGGRRTFAVGDVVHLRDV